MDDVFQRSLALPRENCAHIRESALILWNFQPAENPLFTARVTQSLESLSPE